MKKIALAIVLTIGLLLSFAMTASAEILFGASGEIGGTDFKADYASSSSSDVSDSPTQFFLNGSLNLLGTHISLECSDVDADHFQFSTIDFRVGWQLGLDIFKVKAFGGYERFRFSDDALTANQDNTYSSVVGGVGFESKIKKVTFSASALIPVATRFSNDAIDDDDADLKYLKVGIAYAPLPLVDLFVNYRDLKGESEVVDITAQSYTAGVKISF
jgi:hypothetical protein